MTGVSPLLVLAAKILELKEEAHGGYVAVHDRSGQILYREEMDDLYDEAAPFADHSVAEESVDPSAPLDEDLYSEGATDAGDGPDEGSVDPTEPKRRRRKDPE